MRFKKNYNLPLNKIEWSYMENTSLIDDIIQNVNYSLWSVKVFYFISKTNCESVTFNKNLAIGLSTDSNLRRIRYLAFAKSTLDMKSINKSQTQLKDSFSIFITFLHLAIIFVGNLIDLRSAIDNVKDKKQSTSGN